MPNTASAKKRIRQTDSRTLRNKHTRSSMRTAVRKLREAVEAGDKEAAQAHLTVAYKCIDKAGMKRVIHPNNAANKKRGLARLVNAM